ncbi:MAG TPA: biopolymer transporter TolR, partial [Spirochaetia bacterium]|nr:biopolymer transporter TolR [Spirochaetia bacterium]
MATKAGAFDIVGDVGTQRIPGSTVYHPEDQTYTITGGGANTWGTVDEFHLAALRVRGDFILTAEGSLVGKGVQAHRKWGLTIRERWEGSSLHADAAIHGDGLTSLQYRERQGAETLEVKAAMTHADVVQLERSGQTITMRAAKQGEPLVETGKVSMAFSDEAFVGIFICSHDISITEKAVIRNVRLDVAAGPGVDGDKVPSPSRLEVLDVETGLRRVLYTSRAHFEAPNWSRDGTYLLYNQEGRIYRLPLDSRV